MCAEPVLSSVLCTESGGARGAWRWVWSPVLMRGVRCWVRRPALG